MSACPALTKDGTPCERYVRRGSVYCYCHDPERQPERDRQSANLRVAARRALSERMSAVRSALGEVEEADED